MYIDDDGEFQSTPSVKRATYACKRCSASLMISIHTLCEEGDKSNLSLSMRGLNFNPHPLWRGRPCVLSDRIGINDFNPHPLWRGRRLTLSPLLTRAMYFNPHPLWRGRRTVKNNAIKISEFQSTPSVKRATPPRQKFVTIKHISIHTLCEEGDARKHFGFVKDVFISIHTLCEEGD